MESLPDTSPPRRHGLITPATLVDAFDGAMRRFPVTMAYAIYLSLWAMVEIATDATEPRNLVMALWYLGGIGVPLTLAVKLWCEYLGSHERVPMIVANLLLWADFVYVLCCGSALGGAWTVGRGALVTALWVGIVFIPSRKPMAWDFAKAQVSNIIISVCFSVCFAIATALICATIFALFGVWNHKMLACIDVLGCGFVPCVIFLSRILTPAACRECAGASGLTRFECGTAKFFVLPIVAVYMAVLYVYALRILFSWELPRGVVSLSVTGLSAAVLVLLFMLEGVRRANPSDTLAAKAARLAPWFMLPLLVLMSVAVGYRIGEYGLTASRLYVLTFNIWCYCVFLYLGLSDIRRLNGVALSFAVIFLATSILPWANYVNISNMMMRHSLKVALENAGFNDFPVRQAEFNRVFENLTMSQRREIRSKIEYLDTRDDHSLLDGLTDFGYYRNGGLNYDLDPYENDGVVVEEVVDAEIKETDVRLDATRRPASVPAGFTAVMSEKYSLYGVTEFSGGSLRIEVRDVGYSLPVDSLASLGDDDVFRAVTLWPASGNADTVFVANDIDFILIYDGAGHRKISNLHLAGYVMTK